MPLPSIALRLLLSLCLVLNGLGTAMAEVHMPMFHAAPAVAAARTTAMPADTAAPCHGHEAAQAAPADMPSVPAGHHGAAKPKSPASDCCGSATCQCACMHLAQAMPPPVAAAAVLTHARNARPLPPGHPAPALPHLIRPPIG